MRFYDACSVHAMHPFFMLQECTPIKTMTYGHLCMPANPIVTGLGVLRSQPQGVLCCLPVLQSVSCRFADRISCQHSITVNRLGMHATVSRAGTCEKGGTVCIVP